MYEWNYGSQLSLSELFHIEWYSESNNEQTKTHGHGQ